MARHTGRVVDSLALFCISLEGVGQVLRVKQTWKRGNNSNVKKKEQDRVFHAEGLSPKVWPMFPYADFFRGKQNSINLPRCKSGTDATLFSKVADM
jgi:hypothetical protein